jgi:ABC-type bacteriocin/lantibiotic exporter with double-glycine peptidase domain
LFSAKILVPLRIEADDKVKNIGTESLMQMSLIRATFSAYQVDTKLKNVHKNRLSIEGNSLRSYDIISSCTKLAYVGIFAFIGFYILQLISSNTISQATGIALLVTFFSGTYQLLTVGQYLYRFKDQLVRVSDLFMFMRSYGQQTFPVLALKEEKNSTVIPVHKVSAAQICIRAHAIKFRYNHDNYVFAGHNLNLCVDQAQTNKLYGIIGYSGQGKSTLLSILGGQLKPHSGTVAINTINIYNIDDEQRRALIALQNQNSTGFYGSIRYNLTFGLLKNQHVEDHELIEILKRVGLWDMLQQKRGLDTKVSEGGLALSSGQRQRLDFASVYVRAKYYKPAFVLLDEPTSNLDEENERNVIGMMQELAQKSIVLVISHRLRTLEKTKGILDLSLTDTKQLVFMCPAELAQKSYYYRQLLTGTITGALSKKHEYDVDMQRTVDAINLLG